MARPLVKYVPPKWASNIVNPPSTYVQLAQRPTPIHPWRLPDVPNGFEVSIKRDDLTGSTLCGNKVRKLEFLLADAINKGCDTVVTCGAETSNHCRATAVAAREIGLECYLFLKMKNDVDPTKLGSDGNQLLDRLCGTNIVAIPNVSYKSKGTKTEPTYVEGIEEKMIKMTEKLKKDGHIPYLIPMGGSNTIGLWGYIETFKEMIEQETGREGAGHITDVKRKRSPFKSKYNVIAKGWGGLCEQFDDIVVPMGSGGTGKSLAIANYLSKSELKIHAVVVFEAAPFFRNHINDNLRELQLMKEDGNLLQSDDIIDIIDGYKGLGYGVSTQQELDLLLRISSHTGVILDPVYTVKAVNGMLTEMSINPQRFKGKRVLFIHTGGLFVNFGKLNSLAKETITTNKVKTMEDWLL